MEQKRKNDFCSYFIIGKFISIWISDSGGDEFAYNKIRLVFQPADGCDGYRKPPSVP